MAARKFFETSFGGVRLWCASVATDGSRSVVVQSYNRGNVPDVRDKGGAPVIAHCSLLFDDLTGAVGEPAERLAAIVALKNKGKSQLFVHPLYGSYLAQITEWSDLVSPDGTITAEATFIATEEVDPANGTTIGISDDISVDAIGVRVDELTSELSAVQGVGFGDRTLDSDIPEQATAFGQVVDAAQSARSVLVGVASISDRLWDEVDALQLAADVALWPLMKSYVMVGEAVRAAGTQAMGDAGEFYMLRVDGPTSLRRLVADIYPAEEAADRYDEVMSNNDIRTPARLAAGTQLRLLQPDRR